jgi:hypothetical protein
MSTQTLTKPRPGGPREALEPSNTLPPEPIYPARVKLASKLSELEHALANLDDYRGKAARAAIDEQEALDNVKLSESEAALAISRAQNVKSIYASRTQNKEKAIVSLAAELANAINATAGELRGLVSTEVARRREVIGARVLEALEAVDNPHRGPVLAQMLEFSGPIVRVLRLNPAYQIVTPGNNEALMQTAKDVLSKFGIAVAATGETV